jgi:hypothetical protein
MKKPTPNQCTIKLGRIELDAIHSRPSPTPQGNRAEIELRDDGSFAA